MSPCRSYLIAGAIAMLSGGGHADVLVLTDGRALYGEIVRENDSEVQFRHQLAGEWTTQTFERQLVRAAYPEDGDQSDRGKEEGGESGGGGGDAGAESDQGTGGGDDKIASQGTPVAVIPLHGQVGGVIEGSVSGTFDVALVEACLEEAQKQGARLVVLDIQSPGGLVSEMEVICEMILDWRDRLRIIAYPNEAFSAAAIITMCCPEIVVRPGSLIGAATIVEQGTGGAMDALDAKMASPHYARQRLYMEQSGHPYEVVAAMTIQETQLWWSESGGFVTDAPTDGTGWQEVDGRSTILTMTARDAARWGIAKGIATELEGVFTLAGMPDPVNVIDLAGFCERFNAQADRRLGDVQTQFENYFHGLAALNQAMIALFDAQRQGGGAASGQLRREVGREIGKVRNAGRQIQRLKDAAATRNIEVPREFLTRIEEDQELLGRVASLLDSDDPADWNDAGQRVGTVLKAWQRLLDRSAP